MSNFKVLENMSETSSLIIIDGTKITEDDRYFSYYRGKFEIEQILQIISNCVFQKILEKELFYKNFEFIENINEKLSKVFHNLQLFSSNDLFNTEEKILITNTIKDLILFNKEMDKKINNLQHNLHLLKNDALKDVPRTNRRSNKSRYCNFASLNNLLNYIQNCCIVAKNKTFQGLRYAKIKFIEYAGNINLTFL